MTCSGSSRKQRYMPRPANGPAPKKRRNPPKTSPRRRRKSLITSKVSGRRIRDAELEKIPRVIVYGDKESDESLAVRERGGDQSTKSLDELVSELGALHVARS